VGVRDDAHRIERKFKFRNFDEALRFVAQVGELADCCVCYDRTDVNSTSRLNRDCAAGAARRPKPTAAAITASTRKMTA
jgi:hypothetical protein